MSGRGAASPHTGSCDCRLHSNPRFILIRRHHSGGASFPSSEWPPCLTILTLPFADLYHAVHTFC